MNARYQQASRSFLRFSLGALALAGALVMWNSFPSYSMASEPLTPRAEIDGIATFADVIETVRPAVVNIAVSGSRAVAPEAQFRGSPFGNDQPGGALPDEFMRRFFNGEGAGEVPDRDFEAMGTGFIVDPEGLVVTNYHVVQDAQEITVVMDDGTRHAAELRGYDEKIDLALLDIEGDDLPYVAFGDSDAVRVGDWIVAIGNPFGLGGSATTGIVSARGRDIQSGPFDDFLQIDAPINRGNSGGPLFDLEGRVVGVNTAIFSPNGGNIGIGFAIPAAQVEPIIAELRDKGRVERGWLGVSVQDLDDELAAGLGLDSDDGALVAAVVDGSPAADAGVMPGDVIVGFNGDPVEEVRELVRNVGALDPGDAVEFEVWRHGDTIRLSADLESAEEDVAAAGEPLAADVSEAELGLRVSDLDSGVRRSLQLDDSVNGVLVREVASGSAAAERGLRPGDVIVGVGQTLVSDLDGYEEALDAATEGDRGTVVLQVLRGGARSFVALPVQ